MKNKLLFLSIFLTFALTACSFGHSEPTAVTTPTQAVTSTPSPTAVPVPSTLSEAYPDKLREDIYTVSLSAIPSGYTVDGGEIRDGYVLLQLISNGDVSNHCLILFPIFRPELAKTFEVKEPYSFYKLIDGGKVAEALPDSQILNIYSDSFELIDSKETGVWSLAGSDASGRLWYLDSNGCISFYNPGTGESKVFDTYSYRGCSDVLYEESDSVFFLVRVNAPFQIPIQVNTATGEITETSPNSLVPEVVGPVAAFTSPSSWYFSFVNNISRIYCFKKSKLNESLIKANTKTALSVLSESTFEDDTIFYSYEYRAFSLENGGTVSTLTTELFDNTTEVRILSLSGDDLVLFTTSKDNLQTLHIWDCSGDASEKAPSFHVFDADSFSQEIEAKASSLEEKYGVEIYYDEESLIGITDYYECFGSTDSIFIMNGIEELERCMEEYPENFFRETLCSTWSTLEIYFSSGFRPLYPDQVQHPTSFVTVRENSLVLCIDLNYAQSNYNAIFAHELTHVMEYRINEYASNIGKDIWQYWYLKLNSPDYDYFFRTVDDNGYELTDPTATAKGGDPDAWFVDTYGRSNQREDRARIIEYMYLQRGDLFESENLKAKGRFLISVIREVFPSIGACKEPVLWEKLLGTDGPAFSDYDIPELVPFG